MDWLRGWPLSCVSVMCAVTTPTTLPPQHMGDGEGQHCPAHLRTYQGREEEALLFAQQIASGMVGVVYGVT